MKRLLPRFLTGAFVASLGCLLALAASPARAADNEVKLVRQFGIHYLPLIVMESEKLVEKHAKANGVPDLKVEWATISGGASVNDALLSGAVNFSAGGVGPLIVLWDKSAGGKGDVKAVAAVSDVPMTLTTRNPAIKGIEDFTEKDRIALPAVKTSMQAVTLQMAAAKKWGIESYERLDKFTVAMRHPDAAAALMSGRSEINSHFTAAPYDFAELRTPGIHEVLDSYDVYGGPATLIALYATKNYVEGNPKIVRSVVDAMGEAMDMIAKDKPRAARIYLDITKEKTPVEDIVAMLNNPKIGFHLRPSATFPVAEFLNSTGRVKNKAASWKDLFFPIAHDLKGS
ncbi:MAG: ABC transporter substrate-binding protein [Gammaproteobacteria bacterium]|nr:ABC transporter substrate-binding protein [Gammaproteobacteria bacterium]MBU1443162.1 ABC transporter substrate-binding protein [Gammaproteobacteria bacterium]MBU2285256.1 ABC transporter substrate-binding protein [Gammaproteobacteria bacterium]MBU2407232.1 ABC transporter substrate-binding protein [Gammaproteobacteria bacterium]